jgi:hypothetical protein
VSLSSRSCSRTGHARSQVGKGVEVSSQEDGSRPPRRSIPSPPFPHQVKPGSPGQIVLTFMDSTQLPWEHHRRFLLMAQFVKVQR